MNYIKIERDNLINGPGFRTVLWVSGCDNYCEGCHNPETWNPDIGVPFDSDAIEKVLNSLSGDHITGITITGGDPFFYKNAEAVLSLAKTIKNQFPNKTIWVYTGHLFEELKNLYDLSDIDVIVDGKFIKELKDKPRKLWRGSSNQRLVDVKKSLNQNLTIEIDKD